MRVKVETAETAACRWTARTRSPWTAIPERVLLVLFDLQRIQSTWPYAGPRNCSMRGTRSGQRMTLAGAALTGVLLGWRRVRRRRSGRFGSGPGERVVEVAR